MQPFVEPHAEDLANPVGRQPPQADFAASLKDFVNGEVALENEIATVLDLRDGVEARQVYPVAFFLGELWSQDQGPVIELFANGRRTEPVSGCLQSRHIVHGKKGV